MRRSKKNIKVVIADDYDLILQGLEAVIAKTFDIEIIGKATNGADLVKLARKCKPDVVLTDIKMPKLDGIAATKRLTRENPSVAIIALSSIDEEDLLVEMLRAGARGYVLKGATESEFSKAIRAVCKNENYFCPGTKRKLTELLTQKNPTQPVFEGGLHFTERELQIISLICEGLASKNIAAELRIKVRTVERYRDTIMRKIGVNNVAGLVRYAVKNNLDGLGRIEMGPQTNDT